MFQYKLMLLKLLQVHHGNSATLIALTFEAMTTHIFEVEANMAMEMVDLPITINRSVNYMANMAILLGIVTTGSIHTFQKP